VRESALIAEIVGANARLAGCGGAPVVIPPGDDMAEVRLRGPRLLIATDQVVEGRHWRRGTPLGVVARKAMARNVSDVAAMAAVPACAVASVAFPAGLPDADVRALAEGLRAAAAEFRCPVVGGDIATHAEAGAPLVLSVAITAEPGPTGRVVTRAGARPGDLLCVTGTLGDGWLPDGGGRHLAIRPRVAEALELVERLGERLHAMIDVSDGLATDAGHLADAAGLTVEIDASRLPAAHGLPWRHVVGAGEEHELAFACDGAPPESVAGTPVTVVGRFIARDAARCLVIDGADRHDASNLGWEHGR
jgi:thiamine-monophosphate kinase